MAVCVWAGQWGCLKDCLYFGPNSFRWCHWNSGKSICEPVKVFWAYKKYCPHPSSTLYCRSHHPPSTQHRTGDLWGQLHFPMSESFHIIPGRACHIRHSCPGPITGELANSPRLLSLHILIVNSFATVLPSGLLQAYLVGKFSLFLRDGVPWPWLRFTRFLKIISVSFFPAIFPKSFLPFVSGYVRMCIRSDALVS